MSIEDVILKDPSELSDEEKELLIANAEDLSEEDQEKFGEVLNVDGDGEKVDVDKMKELFSNIAQGVIKEEKEKAEKENKDGKKDGEADLVKRMNEVADKAAQKFFDVVNNRKKILGDPTPEEKAKGDEFVGRWHKALVSEDQVEMKAIEKEIKGRNKYLSTDVDATAGYLVPTELANEVYRILEEGYGISRSQMRVWNFSGPGQKRQIPYVDTSTTAYWIAESAAKRSTQPVFGLVDLILKKMAAIVPMTEELEEDSLINITRVIAELIAESFAILEDESFLTGTGSPFTGVINNGSVQVFQMGVGDGFGDLTADDLNQLMYKVKTSIRRTGKFYVHPTLIGVLQRLKGTDGHYIYQQPQGVLPATMWGKPVIEAEALPELSETAVNTAFIFFTDLKKTAIMGSKKGLRVKVLDQATITDVDEETALNLAEQDMIATRFVQRVGYVLALPLGVAVLKSGLAS